MPGSNGRCTGCPEQGIAAAECGGARRAEVAVAHQSHPETVMYSLARAISVAVCAVAMAACKNVVPDADQPAVITDPDDASRAALQQTVNAVLRTDVMLADDALTETSVLIIERRVPQSIEGSHAQ